MVKQYFAKYLPVDEEVKHGDIYFFTDEQCKRINTPIGSVGKANFDAYAVTHYDYMDNKKAKLFLCSRDIKVGDLAKWVNSIGNSQDILMVPENYEAWKNAGPKTKKEIFKVIGEISPNAKWVKEGDEFDEADWRPYSDIVGIFVNKLHGNFTNSNSYSIKIKCPCCETFK